MKKNVIKIMILIMLSIVLLNAKSFGQIYVNVDATGSNNGTSWQHAYNHLQDALDQATDGDEIWVAKGTYYPDLGDNVSNNDRMASFNMKTGVNILGGFLSGDGLSSRKPFVNTTTLCGNINTSQPELGSYHVVFCNNVDNSAILDGFTIMGGRANGINSNGNGGGVFNQNSSPVIVQCVFLDNKAVGSGGAVFIDSQSSPYLSYCVFSNNEAQMGGGLS